MHIPYSYQVLTLQALGQSEEYINLAYWEDLRSL